MSWPTNQSSGTLANKYYVKQLSKDKECIVICSAVVFCCSYLARSHRSSLFTWRISDVYLCGKCSWSGGRSARTTHVAHVMSSHLINRYKPWHARDVLLFAACIAAAGRPAERGARWGGAVLDVTGTETTAAAAVRQCEWRGPSCNTYQWEKARVTNLLNIRTLAP